MLERVRMRHLPSVICILCTLVSTACTPDEPESEPRDAGADTTSAPSCVVSPDLLYFFDEERRSIAIGDVTGDGVGETATLQQSEDANILALGAEASVVMGDEGYLLGVLDTDMNGDGQLDLILAQPWKSEVAIFLGPIRDTLSWEGADLVFSAPTNGGLENRFGLRLVAGTLDEGDSVDLLIAAPAEGEEACVGQEPPRVFLGPLEPGRYDREDADLVLDAPAMECMGERAECTEGGFELYGQRDQTCAAYATPIS